jgi:D-sedoheptulose 7-phosphate isomerase
MSQIAAIISNSVAVKQKIIENADLLKVIETVGTEITNAFKQGKKVLFCGNGGSAADAQHLAAEFTGRFYFDRDPLDSEALHVNTSFMTAVGNDYSFDEVYSRLTRAKGRSGDILVAISTSGNSKNIIRAVETANQIGMVTVGMTGETGGAMNDLCRHMIRVPSADTPRIQESHILIGHIICQLVEEALFGGNAL